MLRADTLSSGDIDAAHRQITELATQLLDVERAGVWRLDALGRELRCADRYERSRHAHDGGEVLLASELPEYFAALAEQRCLAVSDAQQDPRTAALWQRHLAHLGVGATLDAPVWVAGRVVGVVRHEHAGGPREFDLDEELLAGTIAELVARVVEVADRVRAERALGQYRHHVENLTGMRGQQRAELKRALDHEVLQWQADGSEHRELEETRHAFDASPVPMTITRLADAELRYANERAAALFESETAAMIGRRIPDFYVDPADRSAFVAELRDTGRVEGFVAQLQTKKGRPFWALINAVHMRYRGDDCVMAGFADVTAHKLAELAVRRSELNLRTLFAAAPVPLVLSRLRDGTVVHANQRAADLFELPLSHFVGVVMADYYLDAEQRDRIAHGLTRDGVAEEPAIQLRAGSGRVFWGQLSGRALDFEGEACLLVGIHDVTPQKELEDRLRELATHDPLTGLCNRRHFMEAAAREVERVARTKTPLSLCMLDADYFKRINDAHGHAAGDRVLIALAGAIAGALRKVDVLARVGGEEFEIVLLDTDAEGAANVAERIHRAVHELVITTDSGAEIRPRLSIGITALRPGDELDALLRRADDALYRAKQTGRDRTVVD